MPSSPNPFPTLGEGELDFKVPLPGLGEGFRVRARTFARGLFKSLLSARTKRTRSFTPIESFCFQSPSLLANATSHRRRRQIRPRLLHQVSICLNATEIVARWQRWEALIRHYIFAKITNILSAVHHCLNCRL